MVLKKYFKQLNKKVFLLTSLAVLLSSVLVCADYDESNRGPKERTIYHQNTFDTYTLPEPTEAITLKVLLLEAQSIKIPMRVLLEHDDKLTIAHPNKVFLNQFDQVEYHFKTYAPHAVLNYQFFTETADKQGLISRLYSINRQCRQSKKQVDENIPASSKGIERVTLVYEKSKALEREIHAFQNVEILVNNIINELNLIKKK